MTGAHPIEQHINMTSPTTLDINAIRDYLISVGCKIEYPILVNAFKQHLYNPDPNVQGKIRTQFKDYVNRLATVCLENNMKFILLRPEFRPSTDVVDNHVEPPQLPPKPPQRQSKQQPPAKLTHQPSFVRDPHESKIPFQEQQQQITQAQPPLPPPLRQLQRSETQPDRSIQPSDPLRRVSTTEAKQQPTAHLTHQPSFSGSLEFKVPFQKQQQQQTQPQLQLQPQQQPHPQPQPQPSLPPPLRQLQRSRTQSVRSLQPLVPLRRRSIIEAKQQSSAHLTHQPSFTGSLESRVQFQDRQRHMQTQSSLQPPLQQLQRSRTQSASSLQSLDPLRRRWIIEACNCNYNGLLALLAEDPKLATYRDIVNGYTALHWAAKFGNLEIIKLIAGTHQVSANIKSSAGQTPLHVAYMFNRLKVANLLLKSYNANSKVRDHSGKRPLQYWRKQDENTSNSTNSVLNN